jgi:hypothetical protein
LSYSNPWTSREEYVDFKLIIESDLCSSAETAIFQSKIAILTAKSTSVINIVRDAESWNCLGVEELIGMEIKLLK